MFDQVFAQEDLEEALAMVETTKKEREEINGEKLNNLQARGFLLWTNQLSKAQFNALLWAWGK